MGKEKPPKGKGDPLGDRSENLHPGFDPLSSSNGYSSPNRLSGLPSNFDSLTPEQQKRWIELLRKRNKGLDKL